jgi:hypothetical protein
MYAFLPLLRKQKTISWKRYLCLAFRSQFFTVFLIWHWLTDTNASDDSVYIHCAFTLVDISMQKQIYIHVVGKKAVTNRKLKPEQKLWYLGKLHLPTSRKHSEFELCCPIIRTDNDSVNETTVSRKMQKSNLGRAESTPIFFFFTFFTSQMQNDMWNQFFVFLLFLGM